MATTLRTLRRILFGQPLRSSLAPHERLTNLKALAILSSLTST